MRKSYFAPYSLLFSSLEFSVSTSIEFDQENNQRFKIFYYDDGRPDQKRDCEVNHTLIHIRYLILILIVKKRVLQYLEINPKCCRTDKSYIIINILEFFLFH